MPKTHETEIKNQISMLTEAKLALDPKQKLVIVRKTTAAYVDELWLKFLIESDVLDGYKILRRDDETEIELTFAVSE